MGERGRGERLERWQGIALEVQGNGGVGAYGLRWQGWGMEEDEQCPTQLTHNCRAAPERTVKDDPADDRAGEEAAQ